MCGKIKRKTVCAAYQIERPQKWELYDRREGRADHQAGVQHTENPFA